MSRAYDNVRERRARFEQRWQRSSKAVVVVCLVCITLVGTARSELHVGNAAIPIGLAWDFSDSAASSNGDVYQAITLLLRENGQAGRGPYFLRGVHPAKLAFSPGDTSYVNLAVAPEDTTLYASAIDLYLGVTYVIRTRETHYAKFRVLEYSDLEVRIEYTYQDNGTRILISTVPVSAATWGRVKALYRLRERE